jgi:hypothetical protein
MLTRSRPVVLAALVLTAAALAAPAQAAGPYLKLKANPESVAADQPVTLTLTAVSGRTVTLPAPVISVDEGQGFAARTDLQCTPAAETNVTPDKAATASCAIKLSRAGKSRVRFEYRLPGGMARTNAVSIEVGGARRADE